ncbi:hypothetical protein KKG90_10710 [Candidatus Bipolaricaulota bacterium]|nr:hypothetical protein [Candidatus Bipolaricaulota bacterium]
MKACLFYPVLALLLVGCAIPSYSLETPPQSSFEPIRGIILFDSTRDGNCEIYSMAADGSNQTRLTDYPAMDFSPSGSPDGQWIAFSRQTRNVNWLYIMRADGQDPWALDVEGGQVVWSPDGTRLVYALHIGGNAEICIVNEDGNGFRRLTNNTSGDFEPTWLPDGEHIGWASGLSGNADIFVMRADGTDRVQVTGDASLEIYPNWSPDGSLIAFCSNRTGAWEIYVMSADGTDVRQLTAAGGQNACPRWSPDGSQIAFQSDRDGDSEIFIMNADGTDVRQLTHNNVEDAHPSWIPVPHAF